MKRKISIQIEEDLAVQLDHMAAVDRRTTPQMVRWLLWGLVDGEKPLHGPWPAPTEAPPRRERSGTVYFIGADAGAVKIGFTAGPVSQRLAALQTGNPTPLTVLWTFRGIEGDEQALHRELVEHRLHGEWFDRAPALAVIEQKRGEL